MPKTTASKTARPRTRKTAETPATESSRSGWPAGRDALARAQQEGAKVFGTLLKQRHLFEERTKQATAKAKEMQQIAGGTWDKLEQVFEERVARALSRLGIYTQSDIDRLTERVDALSDAVNRLLEAKDAAAKKPAARPTKPRKKTSPG